MKTYPDYKKMRSPARLGIVGTGFISKGFCEFVKKLTDVKISYILTRRNTDTIKEFKQFGTLTNKPKDLIEHSDIIVELSGSLHHAAEVVKLAHASGRPVVTRNADFHVFMGSQFVKTGFITEAEGDQPGALASLHHELTGLGFLPLLYGNIKGFLNHNPSREEMEYWSQKQGISIPMVTSSTDGSKLQAEMALVANGLGASIMQQGMIGYRADNLEKGADFLVDEALKRGFSTKCPVVDYILQDSESDMKLPTGVFIMAKDGGNETSKLEYYKMGKGPYYLFHKPYYLPHLEIIKTVRRVMSGSEIPFNNGRQPQIQLVPIAKRNMTKGEKVDMSPGGFDARYEVKKCRSENLLVKKTEKIITKTDIILNQNIDLT